MLRFLCLSLMIVLAGPAVAQPRVPMTQDQQVADLMWEVMQLDSLAPILQSEAVAEAEEMAANMFQGRGTGRWHDRVRAIHNPDRIRGLFLRGMAAASPARGPAEVLDGLDFYRSVLGQQLLTLESSTRVAMLDPDVEARIRNAFALARRQGNPRVAQVERLIEAADLIEPNVAGGLNAAIAFSRGFEAGGGFPMPMAEGEIVEDALAQEPQMRADTEAWIGAYLFLAYNSLTDAQLETYIQFAGSSEGQALSRLMFAGFDAVFSQTSYDMGVAAAAEIRGRQL